MLLVWPARLPAASPRGDMFCFSFLSFLSQSLSIDKCEFVLFILHATASYICYFHEKKTIFAAKVKKSLIAAAG